MEELFSTFVRSIFSDNMIFTYYKDSPWIGYCGNIHFDMYVAYQLHA